MTPSTLKDLARRTASKTERQRQNDDVREALEDVLDFRLNAGQLRRKLGCHRHPHKKTKKCRLNTVFVKAPLQATLAPLKPA